VDAATNALLLIGNAAGEAHPIIGEGISMAMQSAWLLCERLLRHDSGTVAYGRIRKKYGKDWRRHFASRLRLAAVFAHLAMRPRLSRGLLPLIEYWPSFLTCGAYISGKVRPLYSARLHGREA
jgi:flavin-dependent dehydrogenase